MPIWLARLVFGSEGPLVVFSVFQLASPRTTRSRPRLLLTSRLRYARSRNSSGITHELPSSKVEIKIAIPDAPGKLKLAELPTPEFNDQEVFIKANCCGMCRRSIKIYQGKWTIPFPRLLGHEFSGEVVEVGQHVNGFQPGDPVTVEEE